MLLFILATIVVVASVIVDNVVVVVLVNNVFFVVLLVVADPIVKLELKLNPKIGLHTHLTTTNFIKGSRPSRMIRFYM